MAQFLKRHNDIVTLKVELSCEQKIHCSLEFHQNGNLVSEPFWEGRQEEFRRASTDVNSTAEDTRYRLPTTLSNALKARWQMHGQDQHCLWVHLVQPYGTLHFIPWERLLYKIGLTVLMLPDFIFPAPKESLEFLDIVICGSAPLMSEKAVVHDDLIETVQAVLKGVDRPLRLHVFTDADVSGRLSALKGKGEIILYTPGQHDVQPGGALPGDLHQSNTLRSPWLRWMQQALKPYSTDVVHFICHGYLSGAHGALLFAQSPASTTENFLSGPVGATELTNFLTQIGAWASVFSSPTDNHSLLGLRVLADEVAQTLPGPMMMFDPRAGSYSILERGYRFIHSSVPPPNLRHRGALYLYCQPYLLTRSEPPRHPGERSHQIRQLALHHTRNSAQLQAYEAAFRSANTPDTYGGKSISAVTAATERMTERVLLQYQQLFRDDVVPADSALHDMSIAMQTLDRLREAVDQVEQQRLQDSIATHLNKIEPAPSQRFEAMAKKSIVNAISIQEMMRQSIEQIASVTQYLNQAKQLPGAEKHWETDMMVRLKEAEEMLVSDLAKAKKISKPRAYNYLSRRVEQAIELTSSFEHSLHSDDTRGTKQ